MKMWDLPLKIGLDRYFFTDTDTDYLFYSLADTDLDQRISSRYQFFQSNNYQTDIDTDLKEITISLKKMNISSKIMVK